MERVEHNLDSVYFYTFTEPSQIIVHSFLALGMGGWQQTMDQ